MNEHPDTETALAHTVLAQSAVKVPTHQRFIGPRKAYQPDILFGKIERHLKLGQQRRHGKLDRVAGKETDPARVHGPHVRPSDGPELETRGAEATVWTVRQIKSVRLFQEIFLRVEHIFVLIVFLFPTVAADTILGQERSYYTFPVIFTG